MIINPQFIGSQQTHRKRRLHRIDLQKHQGEHCIEDQRERRSHLLPPFLYARCITFGMVTKAQN